ncbi:MAG TPA: hypothetical protein VH042_09890 [Solirubrobacterales bacterium]|jgi:hypothetical protein|nr:hypothetical protein [Solirubrobacterales bacterium]
MRGARLVALGLVAALGAVGATSAPAAAAPPLVGAQWVTDVTASGARLHAEINPEGLATSYRFEYITAAAYEENLAASPPRDGFAGAALAPASGTVAIGGGSEAVAVVQSLAGHLVAATEYRYRVRAQSSGGTSLGPPRLLGSQESGVSFALPDSRAWELVSPSEKSGGAVGAPGALFGGGDFQAAVAGSSFAYSSASAFAEPASAPPVSEYLAGRTGGGWQNANLSLPIRAGAYGDRPDGSPYRLFAEDLSAAVLAGGDPCGAEAGCAEPVAPPSGSGGVSGWPELYLRENGTGSYKALFGAADLAHTAVAAASFEASLVGATPDLSHLVIATCAKLTASAVEVLADPGECDPEAQNLYEWSAGSGLTALNLLPGETTSTPGAAIAASVGAISAYGSRVYFSGSDGALYVRDGAQTKLLPETTGGGAAFQAASTDGALAFFTKAGHLYRYSASSQASIDLTPAGGVVGVLGVSGSGAYAYYQDAAGLWQWHEGSTSEIAPGAGVAAESNYPPETGTARVSAGGEVLAFLSAQALADYDSTGHTEAYVWGPPPGGGDARLLCASCRPTGERPEGEAALAGTPPNGSSPLPYRPRALSADGRRLLFESSDVLSTFDTNSATDVYQWEAQGEGSCQRPAGCIALISSGREPEGASFLDASADGGDAYFLTAASLVGSDPGSIDVYDARAGGGLPEAARPIECVGDACQALPSEPEDPNPLTLLRGPENPSVNFAGKKPHKHHGKKHRPRHRHKGGKK